MAKHVAKKIKEKFKRDLLVLDPFCGVGGNVIHFAKQCGFCIGSDIDPIKCEYTSHNTQIYQVHKQTKIFQSDFL